MVTPQATVICSLMELQPELSPSSAANYIKRTWKQKHKGRLKPRPVKAQKNTSKRSQYTVAQQFRWFKNVDKAYDFLRKKNTGVCRHTGKTFGKLIDHFVVGADETNLQADDKGNLRVYGEKGVRKHEKKAGDFRGSCTMFRTGTPLGDNGATVFAMKGKKRKKGISDAFLLKEGCEVGSTVVMTENAFMTDLAWKEITNKVRTCCFDCLFRPPSNIIFRPLAGDRLS